MNWRSVPDAERRRRRADRLERLRTVLRQRPDGVYATEAAALLGCKRLAACRLLLELEARGEATSQRVVSYGRGGTSRCYYHAVRAA